MAFSPKHRNQPTPQWAAELMDLIVRILGIISGFIVVAGFVPQKVSDIISPIITALLIPIALEMKKWFIVKTTKKKIDIKDVDVIKDVPDENKPK